MLGEIRKRRGKENHNQNTLDEKNLFSMKQKIQNNEARPWPLHLGLQKHILL